MRKLLLFSMSIYLLSCNQKPALDQEPFQEKIPVIFDTDANNELDDQHALAYLLFNGNTFDVVGVTVNATRSGGAIENHYEEARRVIALCGLENQIPLFSGADKGFLEINNHLADSTFDGKDAVDFIIENGLESEDKLVVIAVGKLTNVALALKKRPELSDKIKVVWLGSNYPEPGEYNLENDTSSMNYVLNTNVEFEMVTVSYGKPTGTDVVRVTKEDIANKLAGKGPTITTAIEGRHGGSFANFGDYSVNLFEHIDLHGNPPSRALYDMAAVAIVKNPVWGERREIPCPILIDNVWVERPSNPRHIWVWENFSKEEILNDFYQSMEYEFVGSLH